MEGVGISNECFGQMVNSPTTVKGSGKSKRKITIGQTIKRDLEPSGLSLDLIHHKHYSVD